MSGSASPRRLLAVERELDPGLRGARRAGARAPRSTLRVTPWVTTRRPLNRRHHRSTALARRGARGAAAWTRWMTNSRFPLAPGSPESTTPATPAPRSRGRAAATSREDAPLHLGVAHDALARLAAARLELRLDEHERLPAGLGERERRRQREPHRDERDVAGHERGREGQLAQRARVDALEHDHARVVAEPRVQLAVADVERDHARGAALQQDVGEAAGRGAEVEAVEPGGVDAEAVERVGELEPGARDVRRRRRRARAARPRRPARRPSSGRAPGPPSRAPGPGRGSRRAPARRAAGRAACGSRAARGEPGDDLGEHRGVGVELAPGAPRRARGGLRRRARARASSPTSTT